MNEKQNHILKNFKISDENNKYNKELVSLFSSAINSEKSNQTDKLNLIRDLLKYEKNQNKEKNLLDKFIQEKIDINRKALDKELSSNLKNFNTHNINKYNILNNKKKEREKETFITKTNIIRKKEIIKENEKNNKLGKSLNDYFIKNIKDEMVKKGILMRKPLSSQKINYKMDQQPSNINYNDFDLHMKIFDSQVLKEFKSQIKDFELPKKKVLKNVSPLMADKKEFMTKKIPIYIRGFKKNGKDVFHSRKVYDMQYQKKYSKPLINLEELIQNHNNYASHNFKKEKMPFYYFLRTVNNPYQNLKITKKRINSGYINIKFNEKKSKVSFKKI